jgi:predicted DNA-binding transcriptional regulator YafY
MSQTHRLYLIDQLLHDRKVVSFDALMAALEVSRATLKRDLEYMRSRLNAPIEWSREAGGYRFATDQNSREGPTYALPGIWFNDQEIYALLTMQHLLSELGAGGMISEQVRPLMARLNAMLGSASDAAEDIRQKVLIAGVGRRALPLAHFQKIGWALLKGQCIQITYAARSTATTTEREVSPLRLVHYRENWYLDAWCHLRHEIRNFSVDMVQKASVLDKPAKKVTRKQLDHTLGPGYGIFTEGRLKKAKLRFTPHRARWVASEQWHPAQKGRFEADGYYLLEVPYVDDRELVMDVLRYGADCEVVGPRALRERMAQEAHKLQRIYGSP